MEIIPASVSSSLILNIETSSSSASNSEPEAATSSLTGSASEGSLVWTRRRITRISGDRNLNSGSVAVGEQRLNVFLRSFIALMKCNPRVTGTGTVGCSSESAPGPRTDTQAASPPAARRSRPGDWLSVTVCQGAARHRDQPQTRPGSPNPGPTTNPGPLNIIEHQPVGASHLCNGSTVTVGLLALSHLQGRVVPVLQGIT